MLPLTAEPPVTFRQNTSLPRFTSSYPSYQWVPTNGDHRAATNLTVMSPLSSILAAVRVAFQAFVGICRNVQSFGRHTQTFSSESFSAVWPQYKRWMKALQMILVRRRSPADTLCGAYAAFVGFLHELPPQLPAGNVRFLTVRELLSVFSFELVRAPVRASCSMTWCIRSPSGRPNKSTSSDLVVYTLLQAYAGLCSEGAAARGA